MDLDSIGRREKQGNGNIEAQTVPLTEYSNKRGSPTTILLILDLIQVHSERLPLLFLLLRHQRLYRGDWPKWRENTCYSAPGPGPIYYVSSGKDVMKCKRENLISYLKGGGGGWRFSGLFCCRRSRRFGLLNPFPL